MSDFISAFRINHPAFSMKNTFFAIEKIVFAINEVMCSEKLCYRKACLSFFFSGFLGCWVLLQFHIKFNG